MGLPLLLLVFIGGADGRADTRLGREVIYCVDSTAVGADAAIGVHLAFHRRGTGQHPPPTPPA